MVIGTSAAEPYMPTNGGATNIVTGQQGTLVQNGLNEAYSYDSFGNITQNGGFNTLYNANNQMITSSYDIAGNQTGNALVALHWDADNKLIFSGGANYVYDANGNRIEKQGASVTDTIYYSGLPIARLSGGLWTDLIYGPNGMLAEVAGNEAAQPVYRLLDHLGSEVGTTDVTGTLTNPLDYRPYGGAFAGSTNDPYLFTGKEHDAESGNDYFGARYYASNMGRWMTPDPYNGSFDFTNPQSLNRYNYVGNNPLRYTDPTGLDPISDVYTLSIYVFGAGGEVDPLQDVLAGGLLALDAIGDAIFGGLFAHPTFNGIVGSPRPNSPITLGNNGVYTMKVYSSLYIPPSAPPSGYAFSPLLLAGFSAPSNCISPGFCKSKIDNMNLMEKGKTSYRNPFSICSTHTTVDNSTGATSSHVDLFNPGTSIPTGPITGNIPALPFHLLFDALPDAIYRVTGSYLLPAGRGLCQ